MKHGKAMMKHGKTMGKHGKTMGKPWGKLMKHTQNEVALKFDVGFVLSRILGFGPILLVLGNLEVDFFRPMEATTWRCPKS